MTSVHQCNNLCNFAILQCVRILLCYLFLTASSFLPIRIRICTCASTWLLTCTNNQFNYLSIYISTYALFLQEFVFLQCVRILLCYLFLTASAFLPIRIRICTCASTWTLTCTNNQFNYLSIYISTYALFLQELVFLQCVRISLCYLLLKASSFFANSRTYLYLCFDLDFDLHL